MTDQTPNPFAKPLSSEGWKRVMRQQSEDDDDVDGRAHRASFGSPHGNGKTPCSCQSCLTADYETRQRLGRSIDAQRAVAGEKAPADFDKAADKATGFDRRMTNETAPAQVKKTPAIKLSNGFSIPLSPKALARLEADERARDRSRGRDDGFER